MAAGDARPVPYALVDQVVLDASGNGQAQVSPAGLDFIITIRSVTVSGATSGLLIVASEYLNSVSDSQFLQGTYDGARDTSGVRQLLTAGDTLYCVWTGGPPGATATFRATGSAWPSGQGAAHL